MLVPDCDTQKARTYNRVKVSHLSHKLINQVNILIRYVIPYLTCSIQLKIILIKSITVFLQFLKYNCIKFGLATLPTLITLHAINIPII